MKKCWDIIWLSIGISIASSIFLSSLLYNGRKLFEELRKDY